MSHTTSTYIESVSQILSFSLPEYYTKFNEDADVLVANAHKIIKKYDQVLKIADDDAWLDRVLTGLLSEAPTQEGRKHVSTVLHLADKHGQEGVVNVAKTWFHSWLRPFVHDGRNERYPDLCDRSEEMSDEDEEEMSEEGEDANPHDFNSLVGEREEHRCIITRAWDTSYAVKVILDGRAKELGEPPFLRECAEATHIIPSAQDIRLSVESNIPLHGIDPSTPFEELIPQEKDLATMWNLLRSWSGIDVPDFAGDDIDSPANGVFLSSTMQWDFQAYYLYFDKDAFPHSPNKYQMRMAPELMRRANLAPGWNRTVEFRKTDTIEPPNPLFLKVHASLAKAIYSHGSIFKRHHGN